ncbi:T9SS type A sorting domain-containing protein [Sporocytophaga myxococcoides]|uniref:T9SS type A sorting domain-containing protein n=1 Tax=Sporocytophaga myxococcoides TaxID=153721 RepID=UPI0012E00593|nr:T9SS type A sorting domain-containing protein [Sporocytophaga myxococcoides]
MKHYKFGILLILLSIIRFGQAQIINGYGKVSSINIDNTTVLLSNVSETGSSFEDGSLVVIMQMQDDIISSVQNSSSFGDFSNIKAAGQYEFAVIASHTETSSVPASIVFTKPLKNIYTTGPNSSVQIITFPMLGNPDYTLTGTLSPKAWDGNTGGVLAFGVNRDLIMMGNLNANGMGFRGGVVSKDFFAAIGCNGTVYATSDDRFGGKGEGVYKSINQDYNYGRGKIINGGGGGGRDINGGGAGGGNYTNGGAAGPGYISTPEGCDPEVGGLGGLDLALYIDNHCRVFMGGGGGGGQQNNGYSSRGGNGGGIIIINSNSIKVNGCASITANGENALNVLNDGAGGGGAGGTIIINTKEWIFNSACLNVVANGGNGGNVNFHLTHAGGGGGGQGAIIFNDKALTSGTVVTKAGLGGCNQTGCASKAFSGGGNLNDGVLSLKACDTILPVQFLDFKLYYPDKESVLLNWSTASEKNNSFFEVQKSINGIDWKALGLIKGAGNSQGVLHYEYLETSGSSGYFRIKQVDFNGDVSFSKILYSGNILFNNLMISPNPTSGNVLIQGVDLKVVQLEVFNSLGEAVTPQLKQLSEGVIMETQAWQSGIYFVKVNNFFEQKVLKLIVEN